MDTFIMTVISSMLSGTTPLPYTWGVWLSVRETPTGVENLRGTVTPMLNNGNISALMALCDEKPPVTGGFPSQRPVTRSFDIFFDLRLSKQPRRRWFEMPTLSLWRHCNGRSEYLSLRSPCSYCGEILLNKSSGHGKQSSSILRLS